MHSINVNYFHVLPVGLVRSVSAAGEATCPSGATLPWTLKKKQNDRIALSIVFYLPNRGFEY